jgi:hypothetical protein
MNSALFWRRRTVLDFARGDIEHAICPLVQVTGALRALFDHLWLGLALANLNTALPPSISASRRVS